MIKIIPFDERYVDQACDLAEEMHRNSIYGDLDLNKQKCMDQLRAAGVAVPNLFFRMAVQGDVLYGCFFGKVSRLFFSDQLVANDIGWWVFKERRGSAAAILLLGEFVEWAKQQGARKVMVGQTTALDVDRTTKFYEHCGFRVIGFNTVKDIQ
jgi:hypothetical protein